MKRLLTVALGFLVYVGLWGQTAFEEIAAQPTKAGGIYHMYPESGFSVPAAPPKGFKPFYISHYGRHGARFNSSNSMYDRFDQMMQKAHDDNALTEKGEDFYRRYHAQYPYCINRGGDLTEKGANQHRGIAKRMFTNYPSVFKGSGKIDARSTNVPRCILSMDYFCDQLKRLNPKLEIEKTVTHDDMAFLNPHSLVNPSVTPTDEGYNNKYAYWQDNYKAMCRENTNPEAFFSRLFKDWNYVKNFTDDPMKLEIDFYYLACSNQCLDYEESYWDLFTQEEINLLWEADSYRFFCSKGPDDIQGGRQWAFCKTLAEDFVKGAEKDIEEGRCARLRFGHDIAIMSFMTLMNIDGWSTPAPTPHDAKDLWQDYNVQMGANIQFVFYKNRKGDIIVRFMNNEKDVLFPIESAIAPYYDWAALKAYMEERIAVAEKIIATTQAPPKK